MYAYVSACGYIVQKRVENKVGRDRLWVCTYSVEESGEENRKEIEGLRYIYLRMRQRCVMMMITPIMKA